VTDAGEILRLVAGLRHGGPVSRGRTLAELGRAVASLTPRDKRELALLVAQRTAPDLVPRIQADTSSDFTAQQVQAVVDLLGRLTVDDVETLQVTVADPDARRRALDDLGAASLSAALATVAPRGEPEPQPQPEPVPEPVAEPRPEPEREPDPEPAAEPEPEPPAKPAPPPPVTSLFDELPNFDLPDTLAPRPAVAAVPPLVEAVRVAPTNVARLRLLAAVDHVAPVDLDQLIRAVPDGWARRRAVQLLLDRGLVPEEAVIAIVGLLGRSSARTWIAASAVEAGVLDPSRLGDVVDARAAARLRRRYA
jgi:hypothetical protein